MAVQACKWLFLSLALTRTLSLSTSYSFLTSISSSGIPSIATAGFELSGCSEVEITSTAQKNTDFVWAVRLAKISKGLIDRRWSHETLSKGATFGLGGDRESAQDIIDALQDEGLESATEANFEVADDVFVVGTDGGETL